MLRNALLRFIRRIVGTQQILDRLNSSTLNLPADGSNRIHEDGGLKLLQSTQYSRYAIPVDYLPSREFRPRYGYTQPKIQALEVWFNSHAEDYRKFLRDMRSLEISHIAHSIRDPKASKPAWTGGAICAFDSLVI